jgi:hypothetical protein
MADNKDPKRPIRERAVVAPATRLLPAIGFHAAHGRRSDPRPGTSREAELVVREEA